LRDFPYAWNQFERALEVSCTNLESLLLCRFDPGRTSQQIDGARDAFAGACQEVERRGLKAGALDSDLTELVLEIRFELRGLQTLDADVSGDAGIKGPMGTQAQGREQVLVTDQDQSEGRLLGKVESQQHTDFFERAGIVVLRLIEQEYRNDTSEFGEGLFEQFKVGAALIMWIADSGSRPEARC
jgi:hypothetical protein